jgi:hypothetical protein
MLGLQQNNNFVAIDLNFAYLQLLDLHTVDKPDTSSKLKLTRLS